MKLRALFAGLCLTVMASSASAAFPTIEIGPQLIQNIIQRIQQAQQLLEQIEQRKIENQQYQINLRDFRGPNQYLWSQPSGNIRQMLGLTGELKDLRDYVSTVQQLLEKYQTYKDYGRTACFSDGQCDEADRQRLTRMIEQANAMNSDIARSNSNNMVTLLQQQKTRLQADADKLQQLERNATSPAGRNEALSYANQFASAQSNQLLQIRALMIAQQNTAVMKMKADQAEEDMRAAADKRLMKWHPVQETRNQNDNLLQYIDLAKPR